MRSREPVDASRERLPLWLVRDPLQFTIGLDDTIPSSPIRTLFPTKTITVDLVYRLEQNCKIRVCFISFIICVLFCRNAVDIDSAVIV